MQTRRVCWYCRYQSLMTDSVAGRDFHACPRCGMESYQFVASQLDRVLGTPYFVHSFGDCMRVSRERVHLLSDGLLKNDYRTGRAEKLNAFIPQY